MIRLLWYADDRDGLDGASFVPRHYMSRKLIFPSQQGSYPKVLVSYKPNSTGVDINTYPWFTYQPVNASGVLTGSPTVQTPTYKTSSGDTG